MCSIQHTLFKKKKSNYSLVQTHKLWLIYIIKYYTANKINKLEQWFSNFMAHRNHQKDLVRKKKENAGSCP